MCKDLSGIVIRPFGGQPLEVRFDQTRHHAVLVASLGLREGENPAEPLFARIEYDYEADSLTIDETLRPLWLGAETEEAVLAECRAYAARITIDADRPAVSGAGKGA